VFLLPDKVIFTGGMMSARGEDYMEGTAERCIWTVSAQKGKQLFEGVSQTAVFFVYKATQKKHW